MSQNLDAGLATVGYLLLIGAVLAHMFARIKTPTFCALWTVGMAITCVRSYLLGSAFAFWTGLASMAIVAGVWVAERRKENKGS